MMPPKPPQHPHAPRCDSQDHRRRMKHPAATQIEPIFATACFGGRRPQVKKKTQAPPFVVILKPSRQPSQDSRSRSRVSPGLTLYSSAHIGSHICRNPLFIAAFVSHKYALYDKFVFHFYGSAFLASKMLAACRARTVRCLKGKNSSCSKYQSLARWDYC